MTSVYHKRCVWTRDETNDSRFLTTKYKQTYLKTTQDVSLGIGEGLSLFDGDGLGDVILKERKEKKSER